MSEPGDTENIENEGFEPRTSSIYPTITVKYGGTR